MPTAPPECTHNHSECRISIIRTASVGVQASSVYNGEGIIVNPPGPPRTQIDCLCETCGLQWSEESSMSPDPTIRPTIKNVRTIGART